MNGLDDIVRAVIGVLFAGGVSAGVAAARQSQSKAAGELREAIKQSSEPADVLNEIGGGGDGPNSD